MRVDRQLLAFAVGAVVPLLTALAVTPFLARQLSDRGLQLAGAIIVAHAIFGLFDMFRPILIRKLVHIERGVTPASLLTRPLVMAIGIAIPVALAVSYFLSDLGRDFAASVGISLFIFLVSTPFWALLDARGQTGFAYVLRTLGLVIIYAQLALVPALLPETWIPWVLLVGNMAAALLMAKAAWSSLDRHGETIIQPIGEMFVVLGQNLTKSFGDFADRISILLFAGPVLSGQYNLLADIPGKSNMPSQIASGYFYPRICKNPHEVGRFVWVGVLLNAGIVSAAVLFWLVGKPVFLKYYGERFEALFPVFCLLLAVAGTYTLSFFTQAYLRSRHLDKSVLACFAVPAVVGAAFLSFSPPTLWTVVCALLIFRSCSLLMTAVAIANGSKLFWRFVPSYGYGLGVSLFFLSKVSS
ncbi:hypothetical protein [Sphingomicrobium flavum]|uniref:hypothetical protein n=1 Tax=Sphingomicrobium flavum TaxID=1229164 RepID=UPI0021ADC063|nr:hypothetical protein [Sphingomicrobium flavum]